MPIDQATWWREKAGSFPLLTPEQELIYGRQVQEWQANIDAASDRLARRGRHARDRLVAANLRLCIVVARNHKQHVGASCGMDDLIQGGNIGLIRAAEKYDPARGYRFTTYAYFWISQGVRAVVDKDSRTIRMPTTFAGKLHAIHATTQALLMHLGREPTREELAKELGIKITALNSLLSIGRRCASLDRLITDDSNNAFIDALATPINLENNDEQLQELRYRIQNLPPQYARIIKARYFCNVAVREIAITEKITITELRRQLKLATEMLLVTCQPIVTEVKTIEEVKGDQLLLFPIFEQLLCDASSVGQKQKRKRSEFQVVQSELVTV